MTKIKATFIAFFPVILLFLALQFVEFIFDPVGNNSPLFLSVLKWGIIIVCVVARLIFLIAELQKNNQ